MKAERLDLNKYKGITPGTWTAFDMNCIGSYLSNGPDIFKIAECEGLNFTQAESNADALADLPKILQALKDAYERVDEANEILRELVEADDENDGNYTHAVAIKAGIYLRDNGKLLTEEADDATETS